jgi:hypothetical protein
VIKLRLNFIVKTFVNLDKIKARKEVRSGSVKLCRGSEILAGKECSATELFLDSEDLIVFGKTIRSARSSRFNLTSSETANQITNEVVFSFTTAVGYHNTPTSSLTHVRCLN